MWSSSRKPALSWLDRLRSSKGIPITTDLNLEQFLKQSPNSSPPSSDPKPKPKPKPKPNPNSIPNQDQDQDPVQESTWFNTMSSVLAELFVMEDKNKKIHKKKVPRKQTNPKICVLSRSVVVDDDDRSGGGGGGVEVEVAVVSPDNSVVNNEEDDNDENFDVLGCSRLDCVVIDTSNVEWKSENMVMRRGNVWRVREKNLKLKKISLMKKKRKAKKIDNDDEDDDDDSEDEKKKKKKKKKMKQKVRSTSISNKKDDVDDDQCGVLPFEGSPVNNNQISIKRTHPNLDQAPIKSRCKFLSLSANPGKKSFVPHL